MEYSSYIQYEGGEYFVKYCQSHITLLWLWMMLWAMYWTKLFKKTWIKNMFVMLRSHHILCGPMRTCLEPPKLLQEDACIITLVNQWVHWFGFLVSKPTMRDTLSLEIFMAWEIMPSMTMYTVWVRTTSSSNLKSTNNISKIHLSKCLICKALILIHVTENSCLIASKHTEGMDFIVWFMKKLSKCTSEDMYIRRAG